MGEEEEDRPKRSKKSFWSSSAVLLLFCIILGIIIGAVIAHLYIEPLFAPQTALDLKQCKSQNSLLNQENQDCLQQLHALGRTVNDENFNDLNNPPS
jgi:capsule polysaccharide export protein KpsE/RkpR